MEKFTTSDTNSLIWFFSGSEQLSLTLQGKNTTIQEATVAAELAIQYLGRLRSGKTFDQFFSEVVESSKDVTDPPTHKNQEPTYKTR